MNRYLTRLAQRGLKRLGLGSRTVGAEAVTPLTTLDHPGIALYERGDIAFEVPIEKCSSLLHFSYDPAGWHPFVQTLLQYQENPELRYATSVLPDFYRKYRPATVLEAFLGHLPQAETFMSSPLATMRMPPYDPFFPWEGKESLRGPREDRPDTPYGNQLFGPVSPTKGELEFHRLTQIYEAIKRQGYRPGTGKHGDIRGYFLKVKDDYRLVIRHGLHRTPALSALGYQSIRVKFAVGLPRAIFLSDLDYWPQVRSGLVSKEIAERIFLLFFEDDGTYKAERLGLLPGG